LPVGSRCVAGEVGTEPTGTGAGDAVAIPDGASAYKGRSRDPFVDTNARSAAIDGSNVGDAIRRTVPPEPMMRLAPLRALTRTRRRG